MMREKYNSDKEHQIVGMYPGIKGMEIAGAAETTGECVIPEYPQLYRPISPRENLRMCLEGKTPYYMPNNGWFFCDIEEFRPRQNPDNFANHQCIDGGPYLNYKEVDNIQTGWWDMPLQWEPKTMGAMPKPGCIVLADISKWRNMQWPDLDSVDWEEMGRMNKDYLGVDKANQLGIQMTYWERMMCLMGVDNAAVALADEDCLDDVHDFLDALADFYIDYIGRVLNVCPIDGIMYHDDWGTQNGPFFSLDTAMEIFVPHIKKMNDFCHSKGLWVEHHSCGNASALVPAFIAQGDDFWFPQPALNDLDMLCETYGNKIKIALSSPLLPKGSTTEEIDQMAKDFVTKYAKYKTLYCHDVSLATNPNHDDNLYPIFMDAVYKYSRIAYQDAED